MLLQLSNTPIIDTQIADAKTYLTIAASIKDAGLFSGHSTFTNPFFGYFIFLIMITGSIFSGTPLHFILAFQIILSLLTIYFLFEMFKDYTGENTAYTAGVLVAVNSVLIFFDNTVLSVSLINLLNIVVLSFLFKYCDIKDNKYLLAAGIFSGLSVITRASFILFVIPVVIWLYFSNERLLKKYYKPVLMFLAGIFFFVSLISVRNYYLTGEIILISSNYGYNFYVGNNEYSDGSYVKPPFITSTYQYYEEKQSVQEAGRRLGHETGVKEATGYWVREGLSFIFNNPGKYLKLLSVKTFLFFNKTEIANNLSNYTAEEYSSILRLLPSNFGFISAFGLLGLFFLLMYNRNTKTIIILFFIISYFITSAIFWISSEYRAPLIMIFIVLAVYAVKILIIKIREKKITLFAGSLCFILLFSFWSNSTNPVLEKYSSSKADYIAYGFEYKVKRMPGEALQMFLKAASLDTADRNLYFEIAYLYQLKGDALNAVKYYKLYPFIDKIPDSQKTGYLALEANEMYMESRFNEAKEMIKRFIIYDSLNYVQLNNLGSCFLELDSLDEAEKNFRKSVELNNSYAPGYFNIGICSFRKMNYSKAMENFLHAYKIKNSEPAFILRIIETALKLNDQKNAVKFENEFIQKFGKNEKLMAELDKIVKK